jgi:hypothetical protein
VVGTLTSTGGTTAITIFALPVGKTAYQHEKSTVTWQHLKAVTLDIPSPPWRITLSFTLNHKEQIMAKKQGTSKSQAVRDYLKTHRKATNKEVSEALAKAGIDVSPNHVANIKAKTKTRHKAARAVVSRRGLGIPEVKVALALLKECGGSIPAANAALAAAQEIRELV